MNIKECRQLCLSNCSCTAYANSDIRGGSGCLLWFGDLMDMRDLEQGGQDLYIRLAASEIGLARKNHIMDCEEREKEMELPIYSFGTIENATNNFCIKNKLGEGGFGPVYKGTLIEGQGVAVKRLSKNSEQGLNEIKNEVILIAKLQHRNLVKLLGCCIQGDEKLLIY
ncbi:hypothetical protein REPUB_Repub15cG0017000 [Reevesia pubescens]